MNYIAEIKKEVQNFLREKTGHPEINIPVQSTNPNHEGDLTLVLFPLFKFKLNVPKLAEDLFLFLKEKTHYIEKYNLVKGFMNLTLTSAFWSNAVEDLNSKIASVENPKKYLLEYPSPNTNKPLHLGHLRNLFIGNSVERLLKAVGNEVVHCNLYNDKGIHICKSMLAYQKFGEGKTPEEAGMKGDHFVGHFYVLFEKKSKEFPELSEEVQEMYRQWEAGNPEVMELWKKMNNWVYEGFSETFQRLGIDFNKHYYESETYRLGKNLVQEGLDKGIFYKEDDGSVWVDLSEEGLDKKLLLRSDGTSVYITQDLGTTELKDKDFSPDHSVFVIADEQNYHMQVLKAVLKKLGKPYWKTVYHLSYGMVDLPSGKMKSREGTVVDADDLLEEMHKIARQITREQGKAENLSEQELSGLAEAIGQSALKFFILKVNPKKRMLFDPKKSVDFKGHTGPFLLYTYARIQSIHRKAVRLPEAIATNLSETITFNSYEIDLLSHLLWFQEKLIDAARAYDPSILTNYLYDLAQKYNRFYHENPVLGEQDKEKRYFRYLLSMSVARTLQKGLDLLGIRTVERM